MSKSKNLYAIVPVYAPHCEVEFVLGTEQDAVDHGVYVAAKDIADGNYFSPRAAVYLIGPAQKVGEARAADAPATWEWARGVHARAAEIEQREETGSGAARRPSWLSGIAEKSVTVSGPTTA